MVLSKVYLLWLVLVLGGGGWCWSHCDGCVDHERSALLQLKPFFDSYVDGVNNWGESPDCCEWEKVECSNSTRRIIRLFLNTTTTEISSSGYFSTDSYEWENKRKQQWYLNVSLFLPFEELQSLYLSGNSIADFVGQQGFEKVSTKLEILEILDLSDNYFNDTIFPFLSELSSLKSLYLGDNQFTGSDPSNGIKRLSTLKNLKTLDLHSNYMYGNKIIPNLANFTSLRSLSLQGCGLNGTVQMLDFNNLMNLKELYLSDNAIKSLGSSFKEELTLNKLEVLGLSDNLFNNSILASLTSLSNLKSLNISRNILEGPIRIKDINALRSLEELDMSGNQVNNFVSSKDAERSVKLKILRLDGNLFNNSILAFIGRLSNLKSLSFGGTKFHGSIDLTELNFLTHLEDLSLVCYSQTGTTTDDKTCSLSLQSLGLFPSLKTVSLRGLKIQGTSQNKRHKFLKLEELIVSYSFLQTNFIDSIGQFSSLKSLELTFCVFNGSLPLPSKGFCELPNLRELDLSDSNLKGVLPECFSKLTSLQTLDLSGNQFSGNIFPLNNLTSLEMLDLSSNQFFGDISILQSLTSLQTLKLSFNFFSGNISSLENLTSLQMLDLSSNQFSGNISALQSLTSLQELRLSNNNFQIPISLGPLFNLSKLKYIYADNNTVLYAPITQIQYSLGAPSFQLKEMSLSCCGDVGSFPGFLYHQHDLEYLHLSNVFFKGNQFPYWLLVNNTHLWLLYLANSSLSGQLQLPLASQFGLSDLDISDNFFNGSIPVEMGEQLASLEFLNMSNNHFIGSIPSSLGDMTLLVILDLSNNQLSGRIPEHLTMSNPSLRVLTLSNNKLEGDIFSENSYLPNLFELQLDGNNFSGRIPDVLSRSPYLSTLDVSNNRISGGIPRWMGNMFLLRKLLMSNNHLQGTIPVEFSQLGNLGLLDLSVNNISGTLQFCFSPSVELKQIHLAKNRLRGTLPDALRNSSTLVTLDISDNFFTGGIPSWIGGLSNLSYLLLSNNLFQGEIPMELCMLNQLSLINLSHNNLSGRIPPCLKITALENVSILVQPFNLSGPTQFSLNEPIVFPIKNVTNTYKGKIISLVSGIDLSCNKLVGEIPYEFGNFSKILVLNLSHNSLTGPIPPTFANLEQIESLDLSYNKLSGSIPPQLVGLHFLAYFVVSFNNLSGKTPPWSAQFGTFDERSYRGNPFLCGEPLPKCGDTGTSNPSTDGDEEDGLIDMGVFHVSFVVSYIILLLTVAAVLYINPYWRRAWFYHAETTAASCYYFVLDNILPRRFRY